MESPFTEMPVSIGKPYNQWNNSEDEIAVRNPLLDPQKKIEDEKYPDYYTSELLDFDVPKKVSAPVCSVDVTKANKIGFEFDMLISISADLQAKTVGDKELISEHTLSTEGFVLKVDGNKIEVSTKPFELSDAGQKDLQETFLRIEHWINDLRDHFKRDKKVVSIKKAPACASCFSGSGIYIETSDVGKALRIKDKYITPYSHFIFPLNNAVSKLDDYFTTNTIVRGVPQTTMGVPLASVSSLVDKIRATENQRVGVGLSVSGSGWRLGLRSDALYNGQYRVNAARKYFLNHGIFGTLKIDKTNFSNALTGFLILLTEYLWTSVLPEDARDHEGFSKAYVPLHSKTRFREMFHCLLNDSEREVFLKVFWEGDNWKNLFSLMKKIDGRNGGYTNINDTPDIKLFPSFIVRSKPTWKEFVTSIVENNFLYEQTSGYDSLVTDPTSGAIPLTTNGVVLEFRRMGFGTLTSDKWQDMAERLFKIARDINVAGGMVHETFDDDFELEENGNEFDIAVEPESNPSFEIEQNENGSSKNKMPAVIRRIYSGKSYSIFDPASNSHATGINRTQVKKSGLSLAAIQSVLAKTIDFNAIQQLFISHNQLSPGNMYPLNQGSPDVDSVFTEAIHQFQIANYLDPNDQDGIIGQSTLETLGFVNHGLKSKLNSSGFYGQKILNENKTAISTVTNNEFNAANWFQFILKPSWLGVKINDGIHVLLLRKLKEAETWLLSQPQYKGMTPSALGSALGFTADTRYSGARLSSGKQAMHGFGLALDINVSGNPWIGAGWVKNDKVLLQERYRMIKALRNAAADNSLPGSTVFAYLDSIASSSGEDTSKAYAILKQRNDQFITYLKTNASELSYWKKSQTFDNRNPLNGFLNLHSDLVYALRQIAGLAWGAIDFGPNASGDIMHFDMRTIGVGKLLCEKINGFVPKSGHPSITKKTLNNEAMFTQYYNGEDLLHEAENSEREDYNNYEEETRSYPRHSQSSADTYLTLLGERQGQIKGGVNQKGKEGMIAVYAFHHEITSPRDVASGMATGKRTHKPVVITKEVDVSSTKLFNAMVSNERLKQVVINFWHPRSMGPAGSTGVETNYYRITLTNATISSISHDKPGTSETNAIIFERVEMVYEKIEWQYLEGSNSTTADDWRQISELELHEAIEEAASEENEIMDEWEDQEQDEINNEENESEEQLLKMDEYSESETAEDNFFEGFVPKMALPDIRKRIDDYFNKANNQYKTDQGNTANARSQFRIANGGAISSEDAKTKVKKALSGKSCGVSSLIIHNAAYGRAKPAEIAKLTQCLIDAGEMAKLRAKNSSMSDEELIRLVQFEFGIGIDCGGYVQLAFIFAFTGSDNDTTATRNNLGLKERRGDENLGSLPAKHFEKIDKLDAQTGDLIIMNPRANDDGSIHTVIIVEHTKSGNVHKYLVDASWGFLYGDTASGISRRTFEFDTSTSEWSDIHPISGNKVFTNSVGPYKSHPIKGVYRARQKK